MNAILKLMKLTMLVHRQLITNLRIELFNMSTDIFVVDTPWLIERLEERAQKEYPGCAMFSAI